MRFPKVFLQIPHYNNAYYLEECFYSCRNLRYSSLDIHFFNDASTDDTVQILETIDKTGISLHHNEKRIGRVFNYQNCFRYRSDAEWFVNLDSDDYYTKLDWIEIAMKIVITHPKDNIVHIQTNFLTYVPEYKMHILKEYEGGYYLISGIDYLKLCMEHYAFSHLSSIFQVALVKKFGAYIDDCLHTDFFTAMRAAIQGNVLVGNEQVGVWRKHDGNQSDDRYNSEEYLKNQMAYCRFFEWCEDYLSYEDLKKSIEVFEKREYERKLYKLYQSKKIVNAFRHVFSEKNGSRWLILILYQKLKGRSESYSILYDAKNIIGGVLTRFLSFFLTLAMVPKVIGILGVENYGIIGIYSALVSAVFIFDFGLTQLITRDITHSESDSNKVRTIVGTQEALYLGLGVIVFLILFVLGPTYIDWIDLSSKDMQYLNMDLYILICIAVLVQWPHSFYTGVLYGLHRQTSANWTQFCLTLIKNIGVLFVLRFFCSSIQCFFYWQILISILTIIVQKTLIYRDLKGFWQFDSFSTEYLRILKSTAISISSIALFSFVYTDLNNVLLAKWLGLEAYGMYNMLMYIVLAMIMYCATIKNALFPTISAIVNQGNEDVVSQRYTNYYKVISYSLLPPCIFLIMNGVDIFSLWLHDEKIVIKIAESIPWITLGSLFNSLAVIPWAFLIAKNRTKYLIGQSLILAFVSIPLLYWLVSRFQLLGSAYYWFAINLVPFIILNLYFGIQFKRVKKMSWLTSLLYPLVVSLLFSLLYKEASVSLSLNSSFKIVALIALVILSYVLLLSKELISYYRTKTNL